jgi:subtilisin-like proprotein convertase family protein
MNLKYLVTLVAIQWIAIGTRVSGQVTLSTTYTGGFQANGIVPDDNPSGWSNTQSINIPGNGPITDIKVSLNISGGANSDLYGYLSGPSGGFSVLLNQVGKSTGDSVGYLNTGFNITFDGSAASDIHTYQASSYNLNGSGQLTGNWQPDARPLDSHNFGNIQNSTPRTEMLSSFINQSPNGNWTLFIADLSAGEHSTVTSWGMQITAVPEPKEYAELVSLALAVFVIVKRKRSLVVEVSQVGAASSR